MIETIKRVLLLTSLLLQPAIVSGGQETDANQWVTYTGPAFLMHPLRIPAGWRVEPLSQPGISLLRVTAPDGSAALEIYTGVQQGLIGARGLAGSAIANLLGNAEPEGAKVFRDSQRT